MTVNPKSGGIERSYIRLDAASLLGQTLTSAQLRLAVYYTGSSAAGSTVQAWYCPDHEFNELLVNWNNQPFDSACTLADTYTLPGTVTAGIPETWHSFDILSEVNSEISGGDGMFTLVLRSEQEGTISDNSRYVQYITKEYSDEAYRPVFDYS